MLHLRHEVFQLLQLLPLSRLALRQRKLPEEKANRKMQNLQSCKREFEVNFALSYCSSALTLTTSQPREWCEANKNPSLRSFLFGLSCGARRRGNHWNIFYNQNQSKINCFVNMQKTAKVLRLVESCLEAEFLISLSTFPTQRWENFN